MSCQCCSCYNKNNLTITRSGTSQNWCRWNRRVKFIIRCLLYIYTLLICISHAVVAIVAAAAAVLSPSSANFRRLLTRSIGTGVLRCCSVIVFFSLVYMTITTVFIQHTFSAKDVRSMTKYGAWICLHFDSHALYFDRMVAIYWASLHQDSGRGVQTGLFTLNSFRLSFLALSVCCCFF